MAKKRALSKIHKKLKRKTTKKSKSHKTKKQSKKVEKKQKKISALMWIVFVILIIGGFLVYYWYAHTHNFKNFNKKVANLKQSDVIAIVGSEKITTEDMENYLKTIPSLYRDRIDKGQLVSDLINQKLLLMDAKEKGITLNDDEFNSKIQEMLQAQNMTIDQLKEQLNKQGIDYNALMKSLRIVVLLQKYLDEVIKPNVVVNESELRDFYNKNKFFFGNKSFDDVKDYLNQTLVNVKTQQYLMQYLDQLKQKYKIKVIKYYEAYCLLNKQIMGKIFLYAAQNCPPCEEMKRNLDSINVTYTTFDQSSDVFECFNETLKKVGYAMPVLICRDGSYTLSKDPATLKEFVSNCS